MGPKTLNFPQLRSEIRELISQGVYSLYKIAGQNEYLLVTDLQVAYKVSAEGAIISRLPTHSGIEIEYAVVLPAEMAANKPKINCA